MTFLLLGAGRTASAGGGGGGWTPASLGSALLAWYKFDTLTGSDGDPQGSLTDASGNGNTLTAAGALRATLDAADLNSMNTLRFTGGNNRYQFGNIYSGASSGSVYIVLKKVVDPSASTGVSGLWSFGTHGSADHWPFTDGNIHDGFGSSVRKTAGNPSVSMAAYRIYGIHSASADWALFIDGGAGGSSGGTTAFFSTGTNTVSFDGSPWIGISDDFVAGLDGWVAEMFFTNAKQSSTDRQKAEGYLAHRWALTGNLDSAHPYKSTPP